MNKRYSQLYDLCILRRPWWTLVGLLVVLAAGLTGLPDFRLDASADSLLLENDPALKQYRELSQRYGMTDFLFLTVTPPDDLLSPASRELLAALRTDLRALPAVVEVVTMLDVPLVKNVPGRLSEAVKNYRTLESPDVDLSRAREELSSSPLYLNFVLSADGKTTAMRIKLRADDNFTRLQYERGTLLYQRATSGLEPASATELASMESRYQALKDTRDAETHAAIDALRGVLAQYRERAEIHLGGVPMIADDMIGYVRNDIIVFGIGAFVLTLAMLGFIFRELRWVLIPVLVCAYTTAFIMGLLGLIGWKLTVISSNFLALTLILAISINIHLIVRFRELYRERPGTSHAELVRQTVYDMASPCLYTSVTSILGFGSLMSSAIRPVADFGAMMALSLCIVYFAVFSLVPCLMLLFPARAPARDDDDAESGFTVALARITDKRGNLVLALSLAVLIAGGFGIARLEVENSFINYFRQDSEIYQGLKRVDETLGGTTPLEIVLHFPPPAVVAGGDAELEALFEDDDAQKSDAWFTAAKVERIKAVHDRVAAIPGVGAVMSLASIVRVAEDLNQGKEFDPFELNIIYKRLPESLKQELLAPYVSIDADEARVSLRIQDSMPELRRQKLLTQISHELEDGLGLKPADYEIAGLLVLYNNMLQSLYSSQIKSVGGAMLGVMLTLWLLFRNLRAAIIGVIPNAVAAVSVLGFMGWAGVPLDMMTIMIAALTMGIAVEDCIHYLYRYRLEFSVFGDGLKTMYHCHANIARAGFYTTLVVCFGFSILVLSNFTPSMLFGILTTVAMAIAILAALTLMPKLLLWWKPFSVEPKVEPLRVSPP